MRKGKVSVVVPIYKVEKYIHRCIESILNQTYFNLEVILVDDGSPDNCGAIAANYKKSDPRIKVIYKENGGLSDARNHGMKRATGEFTMFVDSDDWLENNMIESLVKCSQAYQAEVVQSAFFYAHEDKLLLDNRYHNEHDAPIQLDNRKLMYELVINERVKNFAWGKLYKTKLINDIPFQKGVLFEDVFWAHQVMQRVEKFVLLHKPLYYYYQRYDSIVASYTPRNLDIIKGLKERHRFIENYYQGLTDESYKAILNMSFIHYNLLLLNREKDKNGLHRKEIQSYISENYYRLRRAVMDDKTLRKQLYLFSLHPYLNVLFLGVRKVMRAARILPKPVGLKQEVSSK
ncbi:Glycosyltransferase involved in cell wall bisynthesis [Virgibacillus subterraneus]|uniref:Glycosyltransferase involved in cell wall bisynthesis n=1 Tax=Virgibacillus subterraneus TaxID=621109 RepID=A0A1H8ZSC9_9BACI|nr:glycosyltransferase family 2 protein [Virgibacillus subterraneus]SEP67187.1 Glycosyltransferase involved in cell wall bisynthesis [Virgibacillus subterraneus]